MGGFFKDEEVKNEGAGDPWKKSERDKALDEYFAGAHPKELGIKFKGAPKAFMNSILNKLKYNYKKKGKEDQPGRAERYEPFRRTSRKGMKFTPNEKDLIRAHRELKDPYKVSRRVTATILARDPSELADEKDLKDVDEMKRIGTGVDLILAYRYLYYVKGISILSDSAYDRLEEEEIEFGAGGHVLKKKIGSDRAEDYPNHIRALAIYLVFKYEAKGTR